MTGFTAWKNLRAVKAHANEYYHLQGWDEVVEAWGDDEILAVVSQCHSPEAAIEAMRAHLKGSGALEMPAILRSIERG